MLLIAEHIDERGALTQVTLELSGDGALLRETGRPTRAIPVRAILLAMRKFGRPLEVGIAPSGDGLELGGGYRLRPLAFRAQVDVEARAYLVLEGDSEPLCAISSEIAAALTFLAEASVTGA